MEIIEKGKLVVVEGACDGIGKTTQYNLLRQRFEQQGIQCVSHHFPSYQTYHGLPVEKYLNGEYGSKEDLPPYFINGLYAMDRAIFWYSDLKRLYEEGKFILLDRYTTSSVIYQSALIEDIGQKKAFVDYITDFEYNKLGIKQPDSVIFLHAPFDLVTKMRSLRKQNAGISNDIHESDIGFMRKVYDSSTFIADYLSWDIVECSEGDRMLSEDEIHEKVYTLLNKKL